MSTKIENFIRAYSALSPAEKKKITEIIKALENSTPLNEGVIIKSFGIESRSNTINFAPAPGSCPTCGK
jgi:hypothetical protein